LALTKLVKGIPGVLIVAGALTLAVFAGGSTLIRRGALIIAAAALALFLFQSW